MTVSLSRRRACSTLALAALAAATPWSVWAQGDTEPFEVNDFDWLDPRRQRPVPVRLYWPAGLAADARVPLVVFSHGIGGSRRGYSYLGSHWASHGYASLHLQHVGSDRSLWSGNVFSLVGRLQNAAREAEALDRVHDLRFALDHLLASPLGERIDARRIVAAGHSYGANTTLLAIGARVERDGQALDLRDPRIAAAVLISAPPLYGESDTAAILRHVEVPTLHITATEDVIRIPGYYSAASDRVAVYEHIGGPRKLLAMFEGGSHSIFTDRAGTGGAGLNPRVKSATRELALAFFRNVFEGDASGLTHWSTRWRDIVARFEAAGG